MQVLANREAFGGTMKLEALTRIRLSCGMNLIEKHAKPNWLSITNRHGKLQWPDTTSRMSEPEET